MASLTSQYGMRLGRPRNVWDMFSNIAGLAGVYFVEQQDRKNLINDAHAEFQYKRKFDIRDALAAFDRQKQLLDYKADIEASMPQTQGHQTPTERYIAGTMSPDEIARFIETGGLANQKKTLTPEEKAHEDARYKNTLDKLVPKEEKPSMTVGQSFEVAKAVKFAEENRLADNTRTALGAALADPKIGKIFMKALAGKNKALNETNLANTMLTNPQEVVSTVASLRSEYEQGRIFKDKAVVPPELFPTADSLRSLRSVPFNEMISQDSAGNPVVDPSVLYRNVRQQQVQLTPEEIAYGATVQGWDRLTDAQKVSAIRGARAKGLIK